MRSGPSAVPAKEEARGSVSSCATFGSGTDSALIVSSDLGPRPAQIGVSSGELKSTEWIPASDVPVVASDGYPTAGTGAASSSSAPALRVHNDYRDTFALAGSPAMCACGKEADALFLVKLLANIGLREDVKCRECKSAVLLQDSGVEVDKYCYNGWLFSCKKKLLKLSQNRQELHFWPLHRSEAWKVTVPIRDLIGVVFGAYTCTFKKQSSSTLPPHWAAFSLISRSRTYDFSARDPEVVESCVRTFQQLIWDKRATLQLSSSCQEERARVIAPSLGAFEPWSFGFFLWMRLRFRLQEEAVKRSLRSNHMLWIVFMKCAFLSTSEVTKARFIDMAEKLEKETFMRESTQGGPNGGTEMRELSVKIQFQKEREMDIVKDRYECRIDTFLPRAPAAVKGVGSKAPAKSGGQSKSSSAGFVSEASSTSPQVTAKGEASQSIQLAK